MRARKWILLAPSNKDDFGFLFHQDRLPTASGVHSLLSLCFVIFGMVKDSCAERKKSDTCRSLAANRIVSKCGKTYFNT